MPDDSSYDLRNMFSQQYNSSATPTSTPEIGEEITFNGGDDQNTFFEEFDERKKYQTYEGFNKFQTIDTFFEDFNYLIKSFKSTMAHFSFK